MAISRERLDELINNGAFIFYIYNERSIGIIQLDKSYGISVGKYNAISKCKPVFYHKVNVKQDICSADKIFETKEQAEWYLKYHATRTEELNLPYWTDIEGHKDDDIYKIASFRRKNGMSYNLLFKRGDLMLWSVQELMNVWIDLATEENYTKLCDLCLKLFKGEENV